MPIDCLHSDFNIILMLEHAHTSISKINPNPAGGVSLLEVNGGTASWGGTATPF